MVCLARQIRFFLDSFSDSLEGWDAYSGKPCGISALSFWLSLWVYLRGCVDPQTGFLINVSEIDRHLRPLVVNYFKELLRGKPIDSKPILISDIALILLNLNKEIQNRFRAFDVLKLILDLTPYRHLEFVQQDKTMLIFRQRFEFSAMHQLWNENFSLQKNFEIFGKCANLAGHGHNYWLDVAVEKIQPMDDDLNWIAEFEKTVYESFLSVVDHKNLNCDVKGLENINPTVENLVIFAWKCLENKFKNARLINITIWENDRTFCSYNP